MYRVTVCCWDSRTAKWYPSTKIVPVASFRALQNAGGAYLISYNRE